LEDQIMRLVEALARFGRVDAVRVVFRAAPHDHACNQAAAGDDVDHCELFGNADGRV
jgi:hypothetical protein